ncbi:FecR family protein, partial [Pseudomonas aeruginosa]
QPAVQRFAPGPVEVAAVQADRPFGGLLVFDEQPLGEVVARLNHYRPGHLLVAPGALAQRRVSGVFRVADLEASLQSISDELGVRSLGLAGVTLLY